MTTFLINAIKLLAASYLIGVSLEYVKQFVKIPSKIKPWVFRLWGLILSALYISLLSRTELRALPSYFSTATGCDILFDQLFCTAIVYICQLGTSMKLMKLLVKQAIKNTLKKYKVDNEEINKILEEM